MGACCTKQDALRGGDLGSNDLDSTLLRMLDDDVLTLILSYCATFPQHETVRESLQVDRSRIHSISARTLSLSFVYQNCTSTATHEFSQVCRRFRNICFTSDSFWMDGLAMSLLTENWNLKGLLEEWDCQDLVTYVPQSTSTVAKALPKLQILCKELSMPDRVTNRPSGMSMARYLFVTLWESATLTLPSFNLRARGCLHIGEPLQLRMEPRYRHIVSELVEGRPKSELDGKQALSRPYPKFLFGSPSSGSRVYVMQLKRCKVNRDGTTDALMVSVQVKKVVASIQRPNSDCLYDVTVARP